MAGSFMPIARIQVSALKRQAVRVRSCSWLCDEQAPLLIANVRF